VKITSFLTKPATQADEIGSGPTTPIVVRAIVSSPAAHVLSAKLAEIFTSLKALQSTATQLFLQLDGASFVTAFALLGLAPVKQKSCAACA